MSATTLNRAKRKKLTPKQRVLRKFPGAFCERTFDGWWCVYAGTDFFIAHMAKAAWYYAAKAL